MTFFINFAKCQNFPDNSLTLRNFISPWHWHFPDGYEPWLPLIESKITLRTTKACICTRTSSYLHHRRWTPGDEWPHPCKVQYIVKGALSLSLSLSIYIYIYIHIYISFNTRTQHNTNTNLVLVDTPKHHYHCCDVIRSAMAFLIPGVSFVCSIICFGADQRKHQSSTSLAFLRGNLRWPMDSPHKRPVTRKMFPFNDVIMMAWNTYVYQLAVPSLV